MRVIYNTCFSDPWVKVAKKLKDEHSFEPVYWFGYPNDNSEKLIPKVFPNCIYHGYYDSWKGNFPDVIRENYYESFLDVDFLRECASNELQALKMMDRMDPEREGFSFMERQRHFRKTLKYLTTILDVIKPDIVISAVVPHRIYDYSFYLLCKYRRIPYFAFRNTNFVGLIYPLKSIESIQNIFDHDYYSLLNSKLCKEDICDIINEEVLNAYYSIKKNYEEAEPEYLKVQRDKSTRVSSMSGFIQHFVLDVMANKRRYFNKDGYIVKGIPSYYKLKKNNVNKTNMSILDYAKLKINSNKYKKRLKLFYESIVDNPDYKDKYILFPLHYQPEMTSNPTGDIFVDQLLCIELLLKNTPNDYYIYVREHPAQFFLHMEGHTSRIKGFYDDLVKYPRVKFISTKNNPLDLIKNATAVATITGTIGWESIVQGKPVIIFGLSWYEKYKGVLRITDEDSASKVFSFIEEYVFDERNLFSYLAAFSKNSIKAYFYPGLKQQINQSEEECVNNLSQTIIESFNNA